LGYTTTTTTGHIPHWPIAHQLSSPLHAMVEKTAIEPPWKTLRVYPVEIGASVRVVLAAVVRGKSVVEPTAPQIT
jgi:hypothetical protein